MGYRETLSGFFYKTGPRLGALAVVLLLLSACAKEDEATLSGLWEDHLNGCGVNCHSPDAVDGTENGPHLTSKSAFYNNLVNKTSDDYPAWLKNSNCNGFPFVKPGDASGSILPTAVIESSSDAFSAAHQGCTTSYNIHAVQQFHISSSETRDNLIDWINDGAKNN